MQINESYYGTGVQLSNSQIYTASFIGDYDNLFRAYVAPTTIVYGGELIDKSITFGEFGDGAPWHKLNLIKYDSANDIIITHKQDVKTVPFYLTHSRQLTTAANNRNIGHVYHNYHKLAGVSSGTAYAWTQLVPSEKHNYSANITGDLLIKPVTKINPQTIMYVPIIFAYNDSGIEFVCDLFTYVNGAQYINYPNVRGITAAVCTAVHFNDVSKPPYWTYNFDSMSYGLGTNIMIDVPTDISKSTIEKNILLCLSHSYNLNYINHRVYYNSAQYYSSMDTGIILGGSIATNVNQYTNNSTGLNDNWFLVISDDFDVVKINNLYTTKFNKYAINDDTINNFRNYVLKQVAYLGGYFTDRISSVMTNQQYNTNILSSSTTYLAIWDGGKTTGRYTQGVDNIDNDAYNWSDVHDNNYKPAVNDDDIGDFISKWYSADIVGTTNYGLTAYQMTQFMRWISSINSTQVAQDFKGKNPVDYIITVLYTPFDLLHYGTQQSQVDLTVSGNIAKYPHDAFLHPDENIQCYEIFDMYDMDVASFDISRSYYDFRDFAPYTTATLSIPFCNTVDIDIAFFYGHKLNVKMSFDCRTGNCTAYILRDSLCVQTVHGTFAVPVVFNAIAQGSYQNALKQNQISFSNSFINAAVGIGSNLMQSPSISSIGNIATALNDVSSSYYQLTHTAPPPQRVGTIGDLNNFAPDTRCNLLIKHYKTLNINDDIYSDTVGHACIKTGKISDFHGYIQCSDVKLTNCHLTANEQNQIKNLLCSGVYV